MSDDRIDVVFVGGIEPAKAPRRIPPEQPVGPDDRVATPNLCPVEHEKVITVVIKAIEIATSTQHLRLWPGAQRLVEYAVAQGLHGVDVRRGLGQPDLQPA